MEVSITIDTLYLYPQECRLQSTLCTFSPQSVDYNRHFSFARRARPPLTMIALTMVSRGNMFAAAERSESIVFFESIVLTMK